MFIFKTTSSCNIDVNESNLLKWTRSRWFVWLDSYCDCYCDVDLIKAHEGKSFLEDNIMFFYLELIIDFYDANCVNSIGSYIQGWSYRLSHSNMRKSINLCNIFFLQLAPNAKTKLFCLQK